MEKIEYLYEEAILFDYISMVEGYVSQYKKNKIIFNWIKEQIFSLKMKYRKYKLKVPDLILTIAFIQFSLEDIETIFYQELKNFNHYLVQLTSKDILFLLWNQDKSVFWPLFWVEIVKYSFLNWMRHK